ncbi:MAG: flavin monoamine oxidase family protein [Pseudomonadota bacterium]
MYDAMLAMGYAAESDFDGPIRLSGEVKGASVLVLGAGLAGLTAAYELRKAGYKVQVLEYNDRAGGRNWSLYGGDEYTDLSGVTQKVQFDKGLYFNPGPWRIPHTHRGILHYCKVLNVPLESFCQVNYSAYVHSERAFGGKPKRFREVNADFNGNIAELLAKATSQDQLKEAVSADEKAILLDALRDWGALDRNLQYRKSAQVSGIRGFVVPPGGGLHLAPVDSEPMPFKQLLDSGFWGSIGQGLELEHQGQVFQPIGGMGMIGKAFGKTLNGLIKYNCQVTKIAQSASGVSVSYSVRGDKSQQFTANADWCVCTIPASILSQIPITAGAPLKNAINSLSYESAFKVGLEFKRRFWEEDDGIYGGITYTDQPISNISYPSTDFHRAGGGVLLGGYIFGDRPKSFEFSALSPQDQVKAAIAQGEKIHPQYRKEFKSGVGVSWHRVPWTLGCSGHWTEENRKKNYANMCAIDGRLVLAGEHCSRLPAWQEGAVLSALDAITRLHKRVVGHA